DLLDDLVAVARLLGEQDEDRRADVALARLGAAPPRAASPARPRRARAGAEAGRPPRSGARSGAGSAAEQPAEVRDVAASPVTAVHMPVSHVLHRLLRSLYELSRYDNDISTTSGRARWFPAGTPARGPIRPQIPDDLDAV